MSICKNCGYVIPAGAALMITEIPGWNWMVNNKTAEVLSNATTGKEEGTQTLYVSMSTGLTMVDHTQGRRLDNLAVGEFNEKVAPILNKITETFEVVGALQKPAWLPLAIVGLEIPAAVFCFVTIKAVDNLKQKLADAGLNPNLRHEGLANTIYGYSIPHE